MFWVLSLESCLRIQVLGPACRLKYNFITNSAVILDKLHNLCASNSLTMKLHASFINPINMTEDSYLPGTVLDSGEDHFGLLLSRV